MNTTKDTRKIKTIQEKIDLGISFISALGIIYLISACVCAWVLKTPNEKQEYRNKSTYGSSDVCINGTLHFKEDEQYIIYIDSTGNVILCKE
jgi:hypothetical protein